MGSVTLVFMVLVKTLWYTPQRVKRGATPGTAAPPRGPGKRALAARDQQLHWAAAPRNPYKNNSGCWRWHVGHGFCPPPPIYIYIYIYISVSPRIPRRFGLAPLEATRSPSLLPAKCREPPHPPRAEVLQRASRTRTAAGITGDLRARVGRSGSGGGGSRYGRRRHMASLLACSSS